MFVRVLTHMLVGLMLGAIPGALYAGLVGAVHFGVYGRWDRVLDFAVGTVLVGAVLGLLGGIAWAVSDKATRNKEDGRSAPRPSRHRWVRTLHGGRAWKALRRV
jgi:hypothetical protein